MVSSDDDQLDNALTGYEGGYLLACCSRDAMQGEGGLQ
jgi:hypothetical protein